jgi:hypothetical protein
LTPFASDRHLSSPTGEVVAEVSENDAKPTAGWFQGLYQPGDGGGAIHGTYTILIPPTGTNPSRCTFAVSVVEGAIG